MASALAAALLGFLLRESPPDADVLALDYVVSPDAKPLLEPLVKEFNARGTTFSGQVVRVTLADRSSGKAASEIGNDLRPDMWTPASSMWPRFLTQAWVEVTVPSLVRSPEVLAVFNTEADRLLLPNSLGFEELMDLVRSGQLDFGHTDPGSSTSGLFAVLSEFSSSSGKQPADLTAQDLSDPEVREAVRELEGKTVHYVDIANALADEWCRHGVSFASAAYMQETTLTRFNARCRKQLRPVPITDPSFVADYPFIVLRAPWVSKEKQGAAEVFGDWLEERLGAQRKLAAGFRRGLKPGAASTRLPPAELLKTVQEAWAEIRRPANVLLLVYESQRMALQGKEELVREALLQFLSCPGAGRLADDHVGMITFGGQGPAVVRARVPIADFDQTRRRLEKATRSLAARGSSALYDALDQALSSPALHDPTRGDAIIVLADGVDDISTTRPQEIETKLRTLGVPIQVLLVPYGTDDEALDLLRKHVVDPSLGRTFSGDVTDTDAVTSFGCQFE